MKLWSNFRSYQQVRRSFLWFKGFGLLVRSCTSGTARAAGTGMRSEMVKGMVERSEGKKLEVSDRSWLGLHAPAIRCQAAQSGCGHRGAGRGRQRK